MSSYEKLYPPIQDAPAILPDVQAARSGVGRLQGESIVRTTQLSSPVWIPATLTSNWDDVSSGGPVAYWRDPYGFVQLRGEVVPNGLGTITILSLPVGYRSTALMYWVGNDNSTTPPIIALQNVTPGNIAAQRQGQPGNKVPVGEIVALGSVRFFANA